MIVLDASAAVELLLRTPTGARVALRIGRSSDTLHAPHLLDLEVTSVLRRLEANGAIAVEEAAGALEDLGALGVTRYGHELLIPRIWQLRHDVTVHDACYLALAEALDAPLLTCDARLATAPGHQARIEQP